jgi:hypothetical protein
VQNVAGHLGGARPEVIRASIDNIFARVDLELAARIEAKIGDKARGAKSITARLKNSHL